MSVQELALADCLDDVDIQKVSGEEVLRMNALKELIYDS